MKVTVRLTAILAVLACMASFMPLGSFAKTNQEYVYPMNGISVNENFDSAETFAGGKFVTADNGEVYTIEGDVLKVAGKDGAVIADGLKDASSLCITSDAFYFISDGKIVRLDRNTFVSDIIAESDADMMYVSENGDIYTLENDFVKKNGINEFSAEGITKFCPVEYGYIYSIGDFLSYTVYGFDAATKNSFLVAETVESWSVEKDSLVVDFEEDKQMISVYELWNGGLFSEYNLYGTGDVEKLLENVSGTEDAEVIERPLTAAEMRAADVSGLPSSSRKTLSKGAENILKRARQMYEIEWTPLKDVAADSKQAENMHFKANVTYQGIPYGQPVHKGAFVGFNATIDQFAAEVKNSSSEMYTTKGENTYNYTTQTGDKKIRYCPYYSNDCSSFVSYAWGIGRTVTSTMSSLKSDDGSTGYKNMGKSIYSLEPGYAICTDGSGHVILIFDVEYDSKGNLLRVTTLEQVEPQMRKRVWGDGGNSGTLADLQAFINGTHKTNAKPYSIIKYMKMDSVTFKACASSPIDNETYINYITMPISSKAEDKPASGSAKILKSNKSLEIQGWSLHTAGIKSFEYRIDSGSWKSLTASYDSSVMTIEYLRFESKCDLNAFYGSVAMPSTGSHKVQVRATAKNGSKYTVADFAIEVVSSDSSKAYVVNFDNLLIAGKQNRSNSIKVNSPSELTLSYNGWSVCASPIKRFEYRINDGIWKPLPSLFRNDVYLGAGVGYAKLCDDCNAFLGGSDLSYLPNNAIHTYSIRIVTHEGDTAEIKTIQFTVGNPPATSTPKPTATATAKPTATKRPTVTKKPAATTKPVATKKPTAVVTVKPGVTTKPVATKKPSTTVKPNTTKKPGTVVTATTKPNGSANVTVKPTATATVDVEKMLSASITDIGVNTLSDKAVVEFAEVKDTVAIDTALAAEIGDSAYTLADMSITDNGKAAELKGEIELTIDVPEGYDADKTTLYTVSDDGKLTLVDSVCASGKLTFKTAEVGVIAIVDGTEETELPTESISPDDETEDPVATDEETTTETEEPGEPAETAPVETAGGSDDGKKNDDDFEFEQDTDEGLSIGAIIGIIAAAVAAIGAAVAGILVFLKKKKNKAE